MYPHKCSKWYHTIFHRIIETVLINGCIIYSAAHDSTPGLCHHWSSDPKLLMICWMGMSHHWQELDDHPSTVYHPSWLVITSSPSWKAASNQTVSCVLTVRRTNATRLVTAVQLVVALCCVLHHTLSDTIQLLTTNSETARLWLCNTCVFSTVLNVFQHCKCWEVFCIHLCTVPNFAKKLKKLGGGKKSSKKFSGSDFISILFHIQ